MLATIPLAPNVGIPVLAGGALIVALGSLAYSYFEWRKEQADPQLQ